MQRRRTRRRKSHGSKGSRRGLQDCARCARGLRLSDVAAAVTGKSRISAPLAETAPGRAAEALRGRPRASSRAEIAGAAAARSLLGDIKATAPGATPRVVAKVTFLNCVTSGTKGLFGCLHPPSCLGRPLTEGEGCFILVSGSSSRRRAAREIHSTSPPRLGAETSAL